jgi:hypothetical protein
MSRKCKHITVSVSQEQYYRARLLAAEYDTTVTSLVATLLDRMPALLRRMNYPKPKLETPLPPPSPGTPHPTPGTNPTAPMTRMNAEDAELEGGSEQLAFRKMHEETVTPHK